MAGKTITRAQYYQLIGLVTLSTGYYDKLEEIHEAAVAITEEDDRGGHTSDAVFNGGGERPVSTVQTLIDRLEITIVEEAQGDEEEA